MRNTFLNQPHLINLVDQIFNKPISEIIGADFYHSNALANIIEEEQHYLVELAAPGLNKNDFNISLEKNNLLVTVDKPKENNELKGKVTKKEFSYDSFKRSFLLPENANVEAISASYTNGILYVTIGKKIDSPTVSKTIEIK